MASSTLANPDKFYDLAERVRMWGESLKTAYTTWAHATKRKIPEVKS